MLEFQNPNYYCEEEVILKIKNNLMIRYQLDTFSATDIAMEIMDMLTLADSDLNTLNKNYIAH